MNTITFPGLNFIFNISRIAFSINSIHIYWYAILIVLAIIIGIIIFIVCLASITYAFYKWRRAGW